MFQTVIYIVTFTPTDTDDYAVVSVEVEITINPLTLEDSFFDLTAIIDTVYTGSPIEPAVSSNTLTKDSDYTVSYANNTNVSDDKASVTITGTGNYGGYIEAEFSITPKEITISDIASIDREYDGSTIVGLIGTLNGGVAGDDISYTGTGTITDGDVGALKDVSSIEFALTGADASNYKIITQPSTPLTVDVYQASIDDVELDGLEVSYEQTGSDIIPEFEVKDSYGNTLTLGDDYFVEIANNTSSGTATITITGTGSGNYDAFVKYFTFDIVNNSDSSNDQDNSGSTGSSTSVLTGILTGSTSTTTSAEINDERENPDTGTAIRNVIRNTSLVVMSVSGMMLTFSLIKRKLAQIF